MAFNVASAGLAVLLNGCEKARRESGSLAAAAWRQWRWLIAKTKSAS